MRFGIALVAFLAGSLSLSASRKDIVEGNPSSPVKVTIYEDLQCGDCEEFRILLDEKILARYGQRVAFVHRDFPLGKHEWARPAAIAARWVHERNPALGITFRREIMSERNHITGGNLKPWLLEFAARNKLDQQGILDSLTDTRLAALVDQDYMGGTARGVSRTPTVYVGHQALVETIIYEDLARLIDTELSH